MRKQVFNSQSAAQAAYDADPAAHSMVGYPAGEGYEAQYTVYFDDNAEHEVAAPAPVLSLAELFAPYERAIEKAEQSAGAAYEAELLNMAIAQIASEVADEMGLAEVDKQMFEAGFKGVHAAVANPRKVGKEAVFRAGRHARQSKGMAQRCRVAAAVLRGLHKMDCPAARGFAYPVLMNGEG